MEGHADDVVDVHRRVPLQRGHARREVTLQQLPLDVQHHGAAQAQQALPPAPGMTQDGVHQPHGVGQVELLSEQQRDPAERVQLRVDAVD